MEADILERFKRELINGYVKKRHPFRYFALATRGTGHVRQRTVVLRKLLTDFTLLVYTDTRSRKIADINVDQNVSALFYHPKQLMQIRLEGRAELITDPEILKPYWSNIPERSRKDYITRLAPGTEISNPDQVDYQEKNHFCLLKIVPNTMEYLQLKRPNHIRVRYTKDHNGWTGQFLVP